MTLEELDGAFVFFSSLTRGEGAEILSLAGSRVDFAGVEAEFAGLEFPDHILKSSRIHATPNHAQVVL